MMLRCAHVLTRRKPQAVIPSTPRSLAVTAAAAVLFFTTITNPILRAALPPRPKPPPDSDIEESYLKGSGPGGQKINKTNSAVQLKHIPTGIVVKSQATRSRDQNRKHAREILAQRIDEHLNGDDARSAVVGRIKQKRSASADKKKKRKYKKLDDAKAQEEDTAEIAEDASEDSPTISKS